MQENKVLKLEQEQNLRKKEFYGQFDEFKCWS